MTRRERELFAMVIRIAGRQQAIDLRDATAMRGIAVKISERLSFPVSNDEITSALATNLAGKGERRTVTISEAEHDRLTASDNPRDELYRIMSERTEA